MQKQKGLSASATSAHNASRNEAVGSKALQAGVSTLILVIIIIVVAVVAVGGVFAYQYFTTKAQPVVQTQQNQNQNNQTTQPSITVTSPNTDTTWTVGNTYQITWQETGIDNAGVALQLTSLLTGAAFPITTSQGVLASVGFYSWTIPSSVADSAGSGFKINGNYTNASGGLTNFVSNGNLTIVAPTNQTVSQQLSDIAIISAINKLEGIQLKKNAQGTYEATYAKMQGSYSINLIAKGDLNGDGFQDAVVSGLGCGASCGSIFTVVINKNGSSTSAFNVSPDGILTSGADQYSINGIDVNNGVITIVAGIFQPSPSTSTFTYKLVGNSLVRTN